jgi:hypothetical protein
MHSLDGSGPIDERAREIVSRAIEIDSVSRGGVAEDEGPIHGCIQSASMDRALREKGLELESHPPGTPSIPRSRKLEYLLVVLILGAGIVGGVEPTSAYDLLILIPCVLLIAGLFMLLPRTGFADRHGMRITDDGIHYRLFRQRKMRTIPWGAVTRIERTGNVLELVGQRDMVLLNLSDFGDPESVLQIIRHKAKQTEQQIA